jgi:signal transduction histidine kinase
MRQTLGIAAGAAAVVCLAAGWWVTGRALAPVADVTKAAARIQSGGRFEERIPEPAARDELRALAVTFNDMLTAIDATLTQQRELVADASHELRGPLMVIRGNLGLMRLDLPQDERAAALQDAAEEVEHMCRLVADLLFLAEEDAGQAIGHEAVAMDDVVREVYDRAWRLDGRSHELSLDVHGGGVVSGDRPRLLQMVWNLADNALRYTPAGGKVAISMITTDSTVEVAVADAGIGIGKQHLPHVFDRFYRADRTRAHQNGSTGLGLAIVKQTALAHGAVVHVQSEEGEGSTFRVVLPRASTPFAEQNDPHSPPAP